MRLCDCSVEQAKWLGGKTTNSEMVYPKAKIEPPERNNKGEVRRRQTPHFRVFLSNETPSGGVGGRTVQKKICRLGVPQRGVGTRKKRPTK